MTTKRILLFAFSALFLLGLALQLAAPSSPRYRADSTVIATPYTNALFASSFKSHIIRTIPGVLALRVMPAFSAVPGSGVPVLTNGAAIRIIAVGPTPEDAQLAANEAASQLCRTALTNYGVTGVLVDPAKSGRRYSYVHDTFQPAVVRLLRLFKH